jgi:hypothetical protein
MEGVCNIKKKWDQWGNPIGILIKEELRLEPWVASSPSHVLAIKPQGLSQYALHPLV